MGSKVLLGYLILVSLFLSPLCSYSGEFYRWTDEKGTIHYTDDASKIPEKFSEQAERFEIPEEMVKEAERTGISEKRPGRVEDYLEDFDKKIEVKRRMEERISELEKEMRFSEERLRQIEEYERENFRYHMPFFDKRTGKLVFIASPYLDEKRRLEERIESIKAELRNLNERISELVRGL